MQSMMQRQRCGQRSSYTGLLFTAQQLLLLHLLKQSRDQVTVALLI